MSGAVRAIGKTFKKVVKTVKKIAPYALAAAAVVFTGGAALGALPTFGAAMSSLVGSVGLSGALGTAVTGALTNAGFGAAVGGVLGGKSGLKAGALTGAITGGLMGPIGGVTPDAQAASKLTGALDTAGANAANLAANVGSTGIGELAPVAAQAGSAGAAAAPAITSGLMGSVATSTAANGGGLLGNPLITSQVLQGLGGAFSQRGLVKAQEEEAKRIQANYDTTGTFGAASGTPISPYAATATPQWSYDPQQKKLVRVG